LQIVIGRKRERERERARKCVCLWGRVREKERECAWMRGLWEGWSERQIQRWKERERKRLTVMQIHCNLCSLRDI